MLIRRLRWIHCGNCLVWFLRHLIHDATGDQPSKVILSSFWTTLSTHHMNTCPTAVLMNVVQSCVRHFATIWKATSEWELRTSKRIKCATLAYILGDSHHPASSFETTSVTQDAGGVKWIQRFTHISSRCFSMLYIYVLYICIHTRLLAHTHLFMRRASQTISISRSDFIASAKEFAVYGILVQAHGGFQEPFVPACSLHPIIHTNCICIYSWNTKPASLIQPISPFCSIGR